MLAYARILLHRHGGEQAAADAVQTVFCRMLELDRRAIAAIADVPAFFLRSTRHAALNLIRAADRARARDAAHQPPPPLPPEPEAVADALAVLGPLDTDDRELLILKHACGLTFDQIALSLDLNRSTVAARYRRAVESLRAAAAPAAVRPAAARSDTAHPEANHA